LSWNPHVGRFCGERLRNFDVVHIFGLYDFLGPAVASACRRVRIPYVVEPIGMYLPIVRNFRLKQMYHLLLGRKMVADCEYVIGTSPQEVTELVSAGLAREKIALRRNGVDAPSRMPERGRFRTAYGIGQQAKLILFLGRLSQKKSPDLLLEAFAHIYRQESIDDVWLVFAGPDESGMRKKLELTAKELGIASRLVFCGPVIGDSKWSAYRDADVFVLPSQNENFGNSAAEAMAAGTPVVVTEQCGIAPMVAGVAGLVTKHDALSLARAIERVLVDPGLHTRLSVGCIEVTSRLSWDEPAREMEELYRRVIPGSISSLAQAVSR
jgi:glycosyltransferase involved in cell wall biosynthesis